MTQTDQIDEQQFDIDDVFNNAGGGSGAPSFAWPLQVDPRKADRMIPVIGGLIEGEITDIYVTVVKDVDTGKPKLNKNGKQQPQINITLQTSHRNWEACKNVPTEDDGVTPKPADQDTGERRIYVKYRLLDALAKAIKASEQKTGGPRVGAQVKARVKDLEYSSNLMRHPLPDYDALYSPPAVDPAAAAFNEAAARQAQESQPRTPLADGSDPWSSATTTGEPPF